MLRAIGKPMVVLMVFPFIIIQKPSYLILPTNIGILSMERLHPGLLNKCSQSFHQP